MNSRRFFSRNGPLSQWHPNFDFRAGQQEMAEAVESAFADKRHLIVEAGTGTGKTLAYLVPAILSGKRIVVSTGTKNLQEQLFFKDVPFLQQHLDRPLLVSYMKGRANYACRQKIYDAANEPVLSGLEEIADFQIIRDWEKSTEMGDRAEIRTLPETSTAWAKVDARRELCTGSKCQQFERCFITQMQLRAHAADIVIVNHHLFFADLALKGEEHAGGIIPEYHAVVFDEAHEIEDVAGQFFGVSASNYKFQELTRDVSAVARVKGFGSKTLEQMLDRVDAHAMNLFARLPGPAEGRSGFSSRGAFLADNDDVYVDLTRGLEALGAHLKLVAGTPEEAMLLARRVQQILADLKFLFEETDKRYVYWLERRGRGVFVQATPIDVAALLNERLFAEIDTAVLTSATLAVAGEFEYAQKRLGLGGARTLVVGGHFDYQKQALMYVPQHLPDPRNAAFTAEASREIERILKITRGRAFVLFTSYQQMQLVHDRVSFAIDYPVLLQGTGPRGALLDEFKSTPNAVLFATAAFWQGVDVPGEQLSCVIIDKLPFAVPSDPVVDARIQEIKDAGGDAFREYQVPQAALALKQGFGRLIRSKTDRGVLVLLDNRITKQRYGQIFFDSLPDYAFTTRIEDVENFF